MNIWHDIAPSLVTPESFTAVIEISKGSNIKYELDKQTGLLRMDRILHTATHYPANYGFIPITYGDDNDPLDVLVLCSESIMPMTLVQCYPIGVIKMIDNGKNDETVSYTHLDVYKRQFNHILRIVSTARCSSALSRRTLYILWPGRGTNRLAAGKIQTSKAGTHPQSIRCDNRHIPPGRHHRR